MMIVERAAATYNVSFSQITKLMPPREQSRQHRSVTTRSNKIQESDYTHHRLVHVRPEEVEVSCVHVLCTPTRIVRALASISAECHMLD